MALHQLVFGFIPIILLCSTMISSSSDSQSPTNATLKIKYVTPNKSIPCGTGDQLPCLTFAEYANEADIYFVNNSTFIFSPGNHILNVRLTLTGIQNISLKGLPEKSANIVVFNYSAGITWESSKNVEISNIIFSVKSQFTYILSFKFISSVKLSNITILGNYGHSGCSSIICQRSRVDVSNSKFVGLVGFSGAALIALESTITFAGSNSFSKNIAFSGGAISLLNSTVLVSGNNSFTGNSARYVYNMNVTLCKTDSRKSVISLDTTCNLSCKSNVSFENNYAYGNGGAIDLTRSTMQLCGNIFLVKNKANFGGAIYVQESNISFYIDYNNYYSTQDHNIILFTNNTASDGGGALYTLESLVSFNVSCNSSFRGNVIMENNTAKNYGGATALVWSTMQLCGNVSLVQNNARYGGAIYTRNSNILFGTNSSNTQIHVILFIKNTAFEEGGALFGNNSYYSSFRGNVILENNFAEVFGGAIGLLGSSMQLCGNVSLKKNNAYIGGAIDAYNSNVLFCESLISLNVCCNSNGALRGNVIMENNSAESYGGAIALVWSTMQLYVNVSFVQNNARMGGAIYTARNSNISFGTNSSNTQIHIILFMKNTAFEEGGALFSDNCNSSFGGNVILENNFAIFYGGAISLVGSSMQLCGNVSLVGNNASFGGAIILDGISKVILKQTLTLRFVQNVANNKGGAIYFHDYVSYCERSQKSDGECFVSFHTSLENISLIFNRNSASKGGAVLYIGQLDHCNRYSGSSILDTCHVKIGQKHMYFHDLFEALMNISTIIPIKNQLQLALLADPENIMFCQNKRNHPIYSVYPGQKFNVKLAASGPAGINANATISHKRISSYDDTIVLRQVQRRSTKVNTTCTNVSYYMTAIDIKTKVTVKYRLYHDNPCNSLDGGVDLTIHVRSCPLGFQLSSENQNCMCDEILLQSFTQKCDINTLSIERKENTFWISKQANDSGLILHKSGCPFDFCKVESVNVSLSHPEEQCDFNRNGTLCGQCKENYSLALGTLHCLKCTNSSFIALIVPFALAGIVLVVVILLLHLTVDVGTLNGLIFYVNIVHSNRQVFLQYYSKENTTFNARESTNIYAAFIAWLNLDFGIETCFYDGMDIYTYSWLQFIFPFYIWFLIVAIIIISRYSTKVSKSLGQNPVAALATLLFISYGKILNAIITPLSLTHLTFSSNDGPSSTHSVWLYDGSIEYFKDPKHIILGVVAILALVAVFVPYTFILLFGHWLMAYSNKCFLSWLNRIKPIMDVYYAPFKQETRYWIGLTLLSRLALLLTIAINAVGSNSVNIFVIASVTASLLFIKGRVYENNYSDFLESSFIFNLCVFSISTFYVKEKSLLSQYAVSSVSIVIAFLTFIGILFFHIYRQLKSSNVCRDFVIFSVHKCQLLCKCFPARKSNDVELNNNDLVAVTSTVVELREPLIDTDDA